MKTNGVSKHKIPRALFITDTFPPFISGSTTMMYNLFLGIDANDSILITQSTDGLSFSGPVVDHSWPVNISRVEIKGISRIFAHGYRWGLPPLFFFGRLPNIIYKAIKKAEEIKPQVVVTCWPSDHYTIAGWITAKILKLPLVVYLHSLWVETKRTFLERKIAQLFEPLVLKSAARVIVATPPTADYLKEKLGINCDILEHTVNTILWPLNSTNKTVNCSPKNILMLGAVNKFNRDTVIAFSRAIYRIKELNLTILTFQSVEQLKKIGLDCSRVNSHYCPRDRLKETILKADILYLPLGFNTPIPKEVKVVIPTRLMDYLPSGIPILAHGPKKSWTMEEADNKGWGYVIDTLDVDSIVTSLKEFISKTNYQEYISNAYQEAKRRDFRNISKLFADILISVSR